MIALVTSNAKRAFGNTQCILQNYCCRSWLIWPLSIVLCVLSEFSHVGNASGAELWVRNELPRMTYLWIMDPGAKEYRQPPIRLYSGGRRKISQGNFDGIYLVVGYSNGTYDHVGKIYREQTMPDSEPSEISIQRRLYIINKPVHETRTRTDANGKEHVYVVTKTVPEQNVRGENRYRGLRVVERAPW